MSGAHELLEKVKGKVDVDTIPLEEFRNQALPGLEIKDDQLHACVGVFASLDAQLLNIFLKENGDALRAQGFMIPNFLDFFESINLRISPENSRAAKDVLLEHGFYTVTAPKYTPQGASLWTPVKESQIDILKDRHQQLMTLCASIYEQHKTYRSLDKFKRSVTDFLDTVRVLAEDRYTRDREDKEKRLALAIQQCDAIKQTLHQVRQSQQPVNETFTSPRPPKRNPLKRALSGAWWGFDKGINGIIDTGRIAAPAAGIAICILGIIFFETAIGFIAPPIAISLMVGIALLSFKGLTGTRRKIGEARQAIRDYWNNRAVTNLHHKTARVFEKTKILYTLGLLKELHDTLAELFEQIKTQHQTSQEHSIFQITSRNFLKTIGVLTENRYTREDEEKRLTLAIQQCEVLKNTLLQLKNTPQMNIQFDAPRPPKPSLIQRGCSGAWWSLCKFVNGTIDTIRISAPISGVALCVLGLVFFNSFPPALVPIVIAGIVLLGLLSVYGLYGLPKKVRETRQAIRDYWNNRAVTNLHHKTARVFERAKSLCGHPSTGDGTAVTNNNPAFVIGAGTVTDATA